MFYVYIYMANWLFTLLPYCAYIMLIRVCQIYYICSKHTEWIGYILNSQISSNMLLFIRLKCVYYRITWWIFHCSPSMSIWKIVDYLVLLPIYIEYIRNFWIIKFVLFHYKDFLKNICFCLWKHIHKYIIYIVCEYLKYIDGLPFFIIDILFLKTR